MTQPAAATVEMNTADKNAADKSAVDKKPAEKSQGFRLTKGWFVTVFACALVAYVVIKSNGEVKQVKVGPAELSF